MAKTTFAGHPLHPQLISAPLGLMPFSLVMDMMYLSTGNKTYAEAAYYSMIGAVVGGLAAGAAGAGDYFAIPQKEERVKKTADLHALMNLGIIALAGIGLAIRRSSDGPRSGVISTLLNVAGNAGLVISGWLGGDLVYHYGMRVKGVSPIEEAPEWKLPGDDRIGEAVLRIEEAVASK